MNDPSFQFSFITDPQIGMHSPHGLDGPDSDRHRLELAIRHVNESDVDFVILGGDLIQLHDSQEQLDLLRTCLSQLTVPVHAVAGNHDWVDPKGGPSLYIEQGGSTHFAFAHKHAFFVGVDAAHWRGNFGPKAQQTEATRFETLIAEADPACTQRFLVMHWPLFATHPDEEESYWNMPNRREILAVLKKHGISCVLSGHWHQDLDADWEGIRLIGSIGTSRPFQYPEEPSFKVFTVFKHGWSARRVSVSGSWDVPSG